MEVLGAVAASLQLVQSIADYTKSFKNALKDRANFLDEVVAIKSSLFDLQFHIQELKGSGAPIPKALEDLCDSDFTSKGALRALEKNLEILEKKLGNHAAKSDIRKRLTWNFIEKDIGSDVETISRIRVTIEHHLSALGREDVRLVLKGQQGLQKSQDDIKQGQDKERKERLLQEVIKWLSPLQSRQNQQSVAAYQGGQWLFDLAEYRLWTNGKVNGYLWLFGDPGVGKSVLSAQIINDLRKNDPKGENLILDLTISQKDSGTKLLEYLAGSLLKQQILFSNISTPPELLERLFKRSRESSKPQTDEIVSDLKSGFKNFKRVYLVVDGWDCIDSTIALDFDHLVRDIANISNASILVTSRFSEEESATSLVCCANCSKSDLRTFEFCGTCDDYCVCLECADGGHTCGNSGHSLIQPDRLYVAVNPKDEDIRGYVNWELKRSRSGSVHGRRKYKGRGALDLTLTPIDRLIIKDNSIVGLIETAIIGRSMGNYQLAKLYMDEIKQCTWSNRREVEETLAKLPEGLDAAYEATMDRFLTFQPKVPKSRIQKLRFVFYWISAARRSLTLSELQQARDLQIGAITYEQIDDLITEDELILNTSGVISVNIVDSVEQSTVHIPLTMESYLHEYKDRYFTIDDDRDIALRLLTCLNYKDMEEPFADDTAIDAVIAELPLLSYACEYWHQHVRPVREDPQLQASLLSFLNNQTKIDNYMRIIYKLGNKSTADFDVRRGLNGLHIAARFGLEFILPNLLANIEVDSVDPKYNQSALLYGARYGHYDTVKQLLESGADVNVVSHRGTTALFEAYTEYLKGNRDCEEIIWLLLEDRKLDIDFCNAQDSDRSLLMMAAKNNDVAIVQALAGSEEVDPNIRDQDGHTALILAIYFSVDINIVKLLLAHPKMALNISNNVGNTALLAAAALPGKAEVVDLLLAAGADPTIPNPLDGSLAIQKSVDTGGAATLDIFLQHKTPVSVSENKCRTLLHYASTRTVPDVNMIQKLLDAGLDIDASDSRGETPLHGACRAGSLDVVKLLLSKGANKTKKDKSGRTAVTIARQNAALTVYCRILHILDPPSDGSAPREQVASYAKELPTWSLVKVGLMDELLSRLSTQRQSHDKLLENDPDTGNTALHWAVIQNRPAFLKPLLAADLPQDSINDLSQTALFLSLHHGTAELTEMLLSHRNPPLNARDSKGMLPLECAQRRRDYVRAVKLIDAGADAATTNSVHLNATFMMAVNLRNATVAELLIKNGADHLKPGEDGVTAKQIAMSNQDDDMLRVLATNKSFFIPVRMNSGASERSENTVRQGSDASTYEPPYSPNSTRPVFLTRPSSEQQFQVVQSAAVN